MTGNNRVQHKSTHSMASVLHLYEAHKRTAITFKVIF